MHPGLVAEQAPERPAIIMGSSGESVTYAALDARSNQLAHLFRERGLRSGDHVAIVAENHPRFLEVAWAAQRSGLYYTPINIHLTADEAAYVINDSDAKVLVASPGVADLVEAITPAATSGVTTRLMFGPARPGWESYDKSIAEFATMPRDDQREGEAMLYSSGTTGRPKGIMRPLSLAPFGGGLDILGGFLTMLGMEPGDVYLSPAPLYHSAPILWSMAVQRRGGTVVIMDRFDPAEALALIERHRVTHSQWVPTMFVRMLKLDDDRRVAHDLSSHRSAIHAAAPCPVDVKRQMIDWWGPILFEYYSATEGIGATHITAPDWLAHEGSVGRAVLGTIHILDDDGRELPVGEIGQVWFDGGLPFGYHKDPTKTAAAANAFGYTTVGDVGYVDEDGYLYLTDRKAFVIISGGVNIYPQEAENVLVMHPVVLDAAVFGIPDPDFGEQVKAVVQPAVWGDAGPALEEELLAFCRQRLAAFKCPRSIDFRSELPRLDNGKLYKTQLRASYWPAEASDQMST